MVEQRTHKPLVGGSNPSSATNAERKSREQRAALLALCCSIVFWSVLPLILKHLATMLDAWTVNASRYMFALLFWLPHVLRHRNEHLVGRNIWADALPPALVHLLGQILFALTPYYNDATIINFGGRTSFVFATLFGFAVLKTERPLARSTLFWVGFFSAISGLSLLYLGGRNSASTSGTGILLILGAAASWGLYSVLIRRCMHGHPVRLSYGVISLYAGSGVVLVGALAGNIGMLKTLSFVNWLWIAGSAITGLALGHVFFFRAIHVLGPIRAEGSLLLIPFLTALLAVPILGERLSALQWTGGFLLTAGCAFLLFSRTRIDLELPPPEEDACLPSLR